MGRKQDERSSETTVREKGKASWKLLSRCTNLTKMNNSPLENEEKKLSEWQGNRAGDIKFLASIHLEIQK